jgi:hypothetical protein
VRVFGARANLSSLFRREYLKNLDTKYRTFCNTSIIAVDLIQLLNFAYDHFIIFFYCCAVQRASRTLYGTQYTHHSLKHMLPQHCKTYNDVFILINFTKYNFSKAQRKLPEDGLEGPKNVGANIEIF